jgi:subtilase family serine protease
MVLGIRALDNYRLKPRSVFRKVKTEPMPNFTSSISGNTFVAPGDFAIIYDVNNLYSSEIDGTGQKIAVMGQTDLYGGGSDITAFRNAAGLPANPPTVVLVPGSSDPGVVSGDIDEASLDVEWAGAVAKNATIIYVNSTEVFNYSLEYAIDQDVAPVISISYGACEANWGPSSLNALALLGQQANTQGQTIVAAAGDSGAADCDSPTSPTSIVTVATHGLAVDAPASAPYITGMGGTEFNEGSGTYWKTATSATGVVGSFGLK